MPSIHTLNARGDVMLSVMREHFSWSDNRTFKEIQRFHKDFLDILKVKGVNYEQLRTALTPQTDKHDAAFLFDSERCESSWYGRECGEPLFKLLDRTTTNSVLSGDLLDDHDRIARKLLASSAVVAKDLNFRHPVHCYAIYVNNLSRNAIASIHEGMKSHPAYLGHVPCTYASHTKTFLSMCVGNRFIKHKNMVILGHEDDRDNSENVNLHPEDYESLGYDVKSLQNMYFSNFLSYKPERMILCGVDDDLEIALRAISHEVAPLGEFAVVIEDAKFGYLKSGGKGKLGKLEKAGIADLTKAQLEDAIRVKLKSNYLYNLDWRDQPGYRASIFSIMLEFPREGGYPERLVVVLEYRPADKVLRLITVT